MLVTLTVIVQVTFAASVPVASVTLVPPATAVTVPAGHVVAAFGVAAIVKPEGKVSVSDIPDSATAPAAAFAIVIVKSDELPAAIVAGANAFVSPMLPRPIVRFAVAGAVFVTPCVVVRALALIVFV